MVYVKVSYFYPKLRKHAKTGTIQNVRIFMSLYANLCHFTGVSICAVWFKFSTNTAATAQK